MPERVTFTTVDDVKIVGDWVAAPTTLGAVILLHMMPTNRRSWAKFQAALARQGLASLAIDLRGHGESTEGSQGSTLDFRNFSDDDHLLSRFDVERAFTWLRDRSFETKRIALCGASFGANLALDFLPDEPLLAGVAALSPGEDFHGTDAVRSVMGITPEQGILFVASEGDDQGSFEAAKAAFEEAPTDRKQFWPLRNAGHGTNMFDADPALMDKTAAWLLDMVQTRE